MKGIHEQNYYELLEIPPTATQEEILQAYNRARATYGHNSPALYSMFNKEEAQQLLHLIDEAYAVLSNQFKRKNYDQKNALAGSENTDVREMTEFTTTSEKDFGDDLAIPNADVVSHIAASQETQTLNFEEISNVPLNSSSERSGKTRFGTYIVDEAMEREIAACEEFTGEKLKEIRLYKNVSLDQLAESTKIGRTYLTAIENDDYKVLPARVFTRGFVVQLAKALDIPEDKVATSYVNRMYSERKL